MSAAVPNQAVLRFQEVWKTYRMGSNEVHALRGISLDIREGEYVSVMGPSGCGKSTLLNLMGCLDRPSRGQYHIDQINTTDLTDDAISRLRGEKIGFVFQSYQLIPQLTVLENIQTALFYLDWPDRESRERALELAERVGLASRVDHRPTELSGGQQQRVAIARALAADPRIVFADEATGNLDSASGREILDMFDELHARGTTLVTITHDATTAERAQRILHFKDGHLDRITERI